MFFGQSQWIVFFIPHSTAPRQLQVITTKRIVECKSNNAQAMNFKAHYPSSSNYAEANGNKKTQHKIATHIAEFSVVKMVEKIEIDTSRTTKTALAGSSTPSNHQTAAILAKF